jgi:hypothetical protein
MPMSNDIKRMKETLREARRYVKTHPQVTLDAISSVSEELRVTPTPLAARLTEMLSVAAKFIQVEPLMCSWYLYGAAFELSALEGRL